MKNPWQFRLPGFALVALLSFVLSCGLTSCEGVDTYTQPSIVRVIDASYAAPAVKVNLDGALFTPNIAQGSFTHYGTLTAKRGALISVAPTAGGASLISRNSTLLPGQQHTILISDSGLTPATYNISLLDDQRTAAASGHSAFRFINEGIKAGAVDIYMIPSGVTLANAVPVVANLSAGSVTGYVNFTSQSVNMVVTAAGATTVKYTSPAIDLSGGEVRTALIMDTQQSTSPAVTVFTGSDVN
jgi:hypothetical protein